jgi:hypothetical protein
MAKEKTFFSILSSKPWWFSAGLAVLVYAALAWGLPLFSFTTPVGRGFTQGLTRLAPAFAFLFLIPASISAYRAWKKRKGENP